MSRKNLSTLDLEALYASLNDARFRCFGELRDERDRARRTLLAAQARMLNRRCLDIAEEIERHRRERGAENGT